MLAQFEALTLENLGDRSHRYSHVRLWGSIGFIATVCVVGLALDHYPVTVIPWVMLASLWLIWLCTLLMPDHQHQTATRSSEGLWALLKKPAAISFLLGGFLLQMSHGPYYTFFTIYLDEQGFPALPPVRCGRSA